MKALMNALVVASGNFDSEVGFQLPQRHLGRCSRIVVASDFGVAEGCPRQKMNGSHHCAHEAFDMAAKVRSSGRAIYNLHAFVFAAHDEGPAFELGGVVDVYSVALLTPSSQAVSATADFGGRGL